MFVTRSHLYWTYNLTCNGIRLVSMDCKKKKVSCPKFHVVHLWLPSVYTYNNNPISYFSLWKKWNGNPIGSCGFSFVNFPLNKYAVNVTWQKMHTFQLAYLVTALLCCWFFQPIRIFSVPLTCNRILFFCVSAWMRMHVNHSNPFERINKIQNRMGMTNLAYDSKDFFSSHIISALDGCFNHIQADCRILKRNLNQYEHVIYHWEINFYHISFFLLYPGQFSPSAKIFSSLVKPCRFRRHSYSRNDQKCLR